MKKAQLRIVGKPTTRPPFNYQEHLKKLHTIEQIVTLHERLTAAIEDACNRDGITYPVATEHTLALDELQDTMLARFTDDERQASWEMFRKHRW